MSASQTTILVLGASGMLGNTVMRFLSNSSGHRVWGSARSGTFLRYFPKSLHDHVVTGIDANNPDHLHRLFDETKPNVVINCIGLVKQLAEADDPLTAIPINSILPHRIARLCNLIGARLVHVSTDCVFSGLNGNYRESDFPDATDLYGRSKLLGEVSCTHSVTLRTSIIGHELSSAKSLINWFLLQNGEIQGYTKAMFSGLPTLELARVIRDYVIPNYKLHGLYHLSAAPISKHDLLTLVGQVYGKPTVLIPNHLPVIDRSLDSSRFRKETGYSPPDWLCLIRSMHQFYLKQALEE